MKQEVLSQFPFPWLPTIALLIFFVFFVALLILLSTPSQKSLAAQAGILPLNDGEHDERR